MDSLRRWTLAAFVAVGTAPFALAVALALVVSSSPIAAAEGFQVIVNTANPASGVQREQLSRIFMKKVQKWENGRAIAVVDQDQSSAARSAFSKAVLGKPVSAVASYWQQQIFAGREIPPVEKASDAAVIAFVKSNPGAVGYLSGGAPPDVKVLTVE